MEHEHKDETKSSSPALMSLSPVDFRFHGKSKEFFGIWIVNVLLSIITLGIYSAWAKVRTFRYLYGSTELDGHRFNYLAEPMQILKGRILAVILFAAYYWLSMQSPEFMFGFMAVMVFLTPFLICSSLRFKMRMTSYRNVRFDYTGTYWQTLLYFVVLPFASIFTLYLAMPWVLKNMDQYIVNNTKYGNKAFSTELSGEIYFVASFISGILFAIIFAVAMFVISTVTPDASVSEQAMSIMTFATFAVYLLAFTIVRAFYKARVRNHIFESTFLQGVANFSSTFSFNGLCYIYLTNIIALICSFGLAYPWTKIRMVNYAIDNTGIMAVDNRSEVIDEIGEQTTAIGDEVANVFDVDVALG
ncbi:YjgN family protein [Thalassotalea sp. Y01]|uniref:YjgN family protein n=1 Tax=Thalassotalea sp. Y01 TaxID=2729613 RepID=UPI00145DE21A|nr:YjgN family protein [Thalassotalea sp. Y01]NMP16050.1 DUF898 domain-containing protein [Thalassotalea sp. Y01]